MTIDIEFVEFSRVLQSRDTHVRPFTNSQLSLSEHECKCLFISMWPCDKLAASSGCNSAFRPRRQTLSAGEAMISHWMNGGREWL